MGRRIQGSNISWAFALAAVFLTAACERVVGLDKRNLPDGDADGETIDADLDPGDDGEAALCGNLLLDEGEECDDGRNGDPDDGCRDDCTFSCRSHDDCDDGHACSIDICDGETHACEHPLETASTLCRDSLGECDVAEYCDGTNAPCPVDVTVDEGTGCDDGNPCTDPDACDGLGLCVGRDIVTSVSAGDTYTCAVLNEGEVNCWGNGWNGQVGGGSTGYFLWPQDVLGLTSRAVEIYAGFNHTCALLDGARLACWGLNEFGQVGDGTTAIKTEAVDVTVLTRDITAAAVGLDFTCVLLTTGGVQCWGSNDKGELGNGTNLDSPVPVDVSGLSSGVVAISSGSEHTCALLDSGGLKCWGRNYCGQIGDGTHEHRNVPTDVFGLSSGVAGIFANKFHTCALMESGSAKCWGQNTHGELGDGTYEERMTPVDVALSLVFSTLSTGRGEHTCGLTVEGGAKCWGNNEFGQLGDGTLATKLIPTDVENLASGVARIATGDNHTCALLDTAELLCWGRNSLGQIGDGTQDDRQIPTDVPLCLPDG